MEAVILMGIQGSGKSTFFRQRLFDTHVRINLDMLRTRRREKLLFEACLAAGQRLAVDNTNPTREDRARYIPAAKAAGFKVVGYFFESDLAECHKRNQQRQGKKLIPYGGLLHALKRLEMPSLDEGFDELYHVKVAPDGGFIVEPWTNKP